MSELTWQKSSYCAEGSNCVELGAAPGGILHLRESAAPERILTLRITHLRGLLRFAQQGSEVGDLRRSTVRP
ncbi:DUF397 domain-containing protein [Streptomyces sp. N2-109]|uniref:DUF397 domain-containing protein n=1 Tax=Streptomyces gossypii TaxID=2883101 RepID=A0ABT2JW87_9ACTN|nr:DUF397 domain-containing protein [Streptomyces gossypii]MCT2592163.1 DUF397 domain-containing protein [Streptomyces gossypii]